jgi:hypothetical protein
MSLHRVTSLVSPATIPQHDQHATVLAGDWASAKAALRDSDCCVVSVSGLESHLQVLQHHWANGPADLDLRARIRVESSVYTREDCRRIRRAVSPFANDKDLDQQDHGHHYDEPSDPCTTALEELARGVASLTDGPLEGVVKDVFLRIVCASNYQARDPMFHTDKAPLRGYVTLRGLGTEFMTRTSTPLEYVQLRGLGGSLSGGPTNSLRLADELEFIVMKGDHYSCEPPRDESTTKAAAASILSKVAPPSSWMTAVWKRSAACVHRSPAVTTKGGRRVIVSLDLGDGDDDREWYEANKKREWRSGMTQRKSHLVA